MAVGSGLATHEGRLPWGAALLILVLTQPGSPCAAAESGRDASATIRGDLYGVTPAGSVADQYRDLTVGAPGPVNRLFDTRSVEGGLFAIAQSGRDNDLRAQQSGSNTGLKAAQSGSSNRLSSTQSDLAMLVVSQRGDSNAIQSAQSGRDNVARLDQAGSYNTITGVQSGSANTATVTQAGQYQTVVYAQSGTGSTLTVRQR